MDPTGTLHWDLDAIASALRITREDSIRYFTDGRRVSFIIERRLAAEVVHGTLALSEGAGYDVLDPDGGKWEVRSLTTGGALLPELHGRIRPVVCRGGFSAEAR